MREKHVFRRLASFTDGGKLKKISSRRQKQTVGRVSGNKTFFFSWPHKNQDGLGVKTKCRSTL